MEEVPEEADVLLVVSEVRAQLIECLYRNPDARLERLFQLAGREASERFRCITDRRERISMLVDHFRIRQSACAQFVHLASMRCELPLDLESRLLSAAGYNVQEETPDCAEPGSVISQEDERAPPLPDKRLKRDYVESYSTAVKTTLLQNYERVTKGVAMEARLDTARVSLQHRTPSRPRERAHSVSQDSEDSSTEDVVTVQSLLSSLSRSPLTVLLGPAGSGKTVLMHCVGQQWARGELPDFRLLFLLEFRQLNLVARELSLIELLFHFFPLSDDPGHTRSHSQREEEEEAGEEVLAFLQANPEKVCVIFDGYDEFCSKFTHWKSDARWDPQSKLSVSELFSGLCSRRILRGCSVLVTCRARNTVDLPDSTMEGELLGFNREQVAEYAEKYFRGERHKEDSVRHLLASRHILTMCYVPALCHLCCVCLDHLFSQGSHSTTQLPATVTQVYLQILTAFLSKVPGGRAEGEATPPLQRYQAELKEVCQLAMEGLDSSRIVFSTQSVPPRLLDFATRAGLLSQFQLTLDDRSRGSGCAFSHLAMQEFLGALHLMTSQEVEEPQLRRKLNLKSRWTARTDPKTVFTDTLHKYVCGLAAPACAPFLAQLVGGGAKGWVERRQGAVLRILQGFAGSPHLTGPKLVELCCCAQETRDVSLARAVAARPSFELRNIRLAPPDMDALAFVLSAAAAPVGLDFAGCSLETECLQALPSCRNIDYLVFRSRRYDDVFAAVLSGILPRLPALRRLEFRCANLTASGAAKLASALESCPEISELNLSDNHLTDKGLREVADKLTKLASLRSVSLGKNSCSLDGILMLLEKMVAYPSIQAVHTDGQKDFSEIKVLFAERSGSLSGGTDTHSSEPSGRTVRLLNCSFTAEKMNQLCRILTRCPGLSAVDLSGSAVMLDGLEILTRTLAVRPDVNEVDVRLQEPTKISVLYSSETQRWTPSKMTAKKIEKRIRLVSCGLQPADLSRLCETLRDCAALILLDVSDNALGDKGLKTLVDFLPQLNMIQEINVSENEVTMEGVLLLADALCTCRTLHMVEVSHGGKKRLLMRFRSRGRRQSGEWQDITHPQQNGIHLCKKFSLTHSDVQPSRIDRLCGKLSHCTELLELNFSHSSLGDASIEKLLQRLPRMAALQLLELNHVQISTEGALLLVRSLVDCQRVKAVELRSRGEACIKFLQIKAEEVACKLTQYQLTCGNVEKLSGILQQCPRISDLDLSGNLLRDEGVQCFVEYLPKLRISNSVRLSDNKLTQTGALCLANSIAVCKRIMAVEVSLGLEMKSLIRFIRDSDSGKALSLRECCFGTAHLQKLADILQKCPHLDRLELCCNTLQNEGFQTLQTALCSLPSLQLLGIRNNGLSAEVILELLKEVGCLTNHLEIRIEEPWIRQEAAVQLVSSCLELNSSIRKIRVYKRTVSITLEKEDTMTTPPTSRDDSTKATTTLSLVKSLGLVDCDLQGHHLQFLRTISQNCPMLQELDLFHNSISREGAEILSSVLPELTNLRSLRLGSKQTSEHGVEILTQGLTLCHSLECLSLAHHVISDRAATALKAMLPRLQSLRAIDLSYCSVRTMAGSHDLLQGLGVCTALEEISLDSVRLDAEGLSLLAEGLQSMASVRRLILNKIAMITGSSEQPAGAIMVLLRSLEGLQRMEEIELDEILMGDHGVQELVRHLRNWQRLRRISLSKIFLSDTGGELLVETLGHCTSLEEIILSRNRLGVMSAAKLGQILPVLPCLKVLDLSENLFGAEGAVKLSESLVQMKSLQKLKLISIGTQELSGLAASLRHCVCAEEVSLAWNNCDDSVAKKLAEVLPQCQKLKCLDLECNKITSAGALELARSLRSCPSVEVVRLWKNSVSSEDVKSLGAMEPRLNFSST